MKTYFYFPAGRKLWFDVARKLSESKVATPVLWFGDSVHDSRVKAAFASSETVNIEMFNTSFLVPETSYDGSMPSFWHSHDFFRTKDRAVKLMDRIDPSQSFKNVDRDVFFNKIVIWVIDRLTSLRPDFLLFSEAPHSVAQYIMYAVAKHAGIPTFMFSSWPLFPVLSMRRDIDGPFLSSLPAAMSPDLLAKLSLEIDCYFAAYETPLSYSFEPRYMKQQRLQDPDAGVEQAVKRLTDGAIRLLKYLRPHNRIASKRRGLLRLGMKAAETTEIPLRYMYFPLHYEPERTTNPDGGDFHDQMRCLAVLRSLIPADVEILVKEHPSQFNHRMKGHLGRSPAFYEMIRNISGVLLVPLETSSAELIRGSESVASVTGTVALEAAILGKPSLVFGASWFEGCPNVEVYTPEFDYLTFSSKCSGTSRDVKIWLNHACLNRGIPGCVNPSNEKYFSRYYADESFSSLELMAVSSAVTYAIE